MALGNNGIIAKAKEARDKTKNSSDKEKVSLAVADAMMSNAGNAIFELNEATLKNSLENQFKETKWKLSKIEGEYLVEIVGRGEYIVDSDGQVYEKDKNPGELEKLAEDVYEINSIEDLVALSYSINKETNEEKSIYQGKTIELGRNLNFQSDLSYTDPNAKYTEARTNNLDGYIPVNEGEEGTSIKTLLTEGNGYIPIGRHGSVNGFYGTIDGKNHKIKNINITNVAVYGGLVGITPKDKNVTIKNIGIDGGKIETDGYAAGIIAVPGSVGTGELTNEIVIDNCYNTATIQANAPVAGIISNANAKKVEINNYYNTSNFTSNYAPNPGIAFSINANEININECYNTGNISNSGASVVGLLYNLSSTGKIDIKNCYNSGKLTCTCGASTGGIVYNTSGNTTISNCYNTGDIDSAGPIGGIVYGGSTATITNCYNTGTIKSQESSAAGIVRSHTTGGSITNCYNLGAVTAGGTSDASGITLGDCIPTHCYNVGKITSPKTGWAISNKGLTRDWYTLQIRADYLLRGSGKFSDTADNAIPLEEAEMKTDEFLNLLKGEQTDSLWIRDNNKNGGFPTLDIK